MKKILLALSIVLLSVFPAFAEDTAYDYDAASYISEHQGEAFLTGKTSYEITGRMVSEPTTVYNPLELVTYDVANDGESVILKGTVGEEWVANISKVLSTYTRPDGSALSAEDFTNNLDQEVALKTVAEPGTNYALFVPAGTVVKVDTAWGDTLYTNSGDAPHGEGDYLVCSAVDGEPDLSDVWVVNGEVFPSTYDMSNAI